MGDADPVATRLIGMINERVRFIGAQASAGLNMDAAKQSQVRALVQTISTTNDVTYAVATA
eukprot:75133-Pyramimonas_sp.AAC.1